MDRKCPCCGCKDLENRNVAKYSFTSTERIALRIITDRNYSKGARIVACSNCGYVMIFEV